MTKRAKAVGTPKLAPLIRLVKREDIAVDQNYVENIRALLRRAESGQSTGLAYVETLDDKRYRTYAIGLLEESPAFCLGTIEVLKARLMKKLLGS